MRPPQSLLPIGSLLLSLAVTGAHAQDPVRQAMDVQTGSLEASAEVQRRIDGLDDQTRDALNEYRQTMAQVTDLAAYNEQLQGLVSTQRVELADLNFSQHND